MEIPWMSIISWLMTFLASKSSGASTSKAALLATGAGLATYYLADPTNKDNIFGVKLGDSKDIPGSTTESAGGSTSVATPSFGTTALTEVGKTLQSWGPTGTLGVIAGTAAATSGSLTKWWPWIAGGIGLYFLTR